MAQGFNPSRLTSALVDLVLLGITLALAMLTGRAELVALTAGLACVWWLQTRLRQLQAIWEGSKLRAVWLTCVSLAVIGAGHAIVFALGNYIHDRFT